MSLSKIFRSRALLSLYAANLLLSFHYFLILYTNSSFLEGFFSTRQVGFLFILGAILNLALLLKAPHVLEKINTVKFILGFALLELLAVGTLTFAKSHFWVAAAFVIHQGVVAMILFGFDLILESILKRENHTGLVRSIYLTIANGSLVIAPLLIALLVTDNNYQPLYILSTVLLLPLFLIVNRSFRVHSIHQPETSLPETIRSLSSHPDILNVSVVQLILQSFYAWMIIYNPIFLHEIIGFPWKTLGIIFTVMLLPFVLFGIPVGRLADNKWGEKEFMIAGLIILAFASALMPSLTAPLFLPWAMLLFFSRIGANFVEVSTESYFFKHVRARDAHIVSFFRIMRPAALILVPAMFGTIIITSSYAAGFYLLAIICGVGTIYASRLRDTR